MVMEPNPQLVEDMDPRALGRFSKHVEKFSDDPEDLKIRKRKRPGCNLGQNQDVFFRSEKKNHSSHGNALNIRNLKHHGKSLQHQE